jgi:hypothetical protein
MREPWFNLELFVILLKQAMRARSCAHHLQSFNRHLTMLKNNQKSYFSLHCVKQTMWGSIGARTFQQLIAIVNPTKKLTRNLVMCDS